ncbi:hypothetical protein [uncultured Draconibacterium sp.]|uniref:hypothetical protein n=1 Tax=uncultured Draconibacterium sp. TaxID=1573823 RepID=UPI0029C8BC6E|nr:hypothetical protein [uncultured Draconibacterium sp.]
MRIFKSNIFWTLFGIVAAVAVSQFYYTRSIAKNEIAYFVYGEPLKIYDSSVSSPQIKIIAKDSMIVHDNVYAANMVIWNNGRNEIKEENIRNDIVINLVDSVELLDFRIVKEVKSGVSGFELSKVNNNDIRLGWDYFDPDFACEIQLVYSGSHPASIQVEGYVLGNEIVYREVRGNGTDSMISISLFLLLTALVYIVFIIFWLLNKKKRETINFKKVEIVFASIMALIMVLYFVILGFQYLFVFSDMPL